MSDNGGSWVVYLMTMHKQAEGRRAVCKQSDWDAMEESRPGYHQLIREGIATESEAEILARGTSGDLPPRATRPSPWSVSK